MSMSSANRATAGATKAYGASLGAVCLRGCFTSAGRNREAALLHVAHHSRLDLGERAEERCLAGDGATERAGELAVGDVYVRTPAGLRSVGRVAHSERPEVRLAGEVRRRRGQRALRGDVGRVDAADRGERRGRRGVRVQPGGELGGGLLVLGGGEDRGRGAAPVADDARARGPLRQFGHRPLAVSYTHLT